MNESCLILVTTEMLNRRKFSKRNYTAFENMLCKTIGLIVWRKPFCTSNLFSILFLFPPSFPSWDVECLRCKFTVGQAVGAQRWRTHSTRPVKVECVLRVMIRLREGLNNCGSGMSYSRTNTEVTLVHALWVLDQWEHEEFSRGVLVMRPLNFWALLILFETSQYFSEIIRC